VSLFYKFVLFLGVTKQGIGPHCTTPDLPKLRYYIQNV